MADKIIELFSKETSPMPTLIKDVEVKLYCKDIDEQENIRGCMIADEDLETIYIGSDDTDVYMGISYKMFVAAMSELFRLRVNRERKNKRNE